MIRRPPRSTLDRSSAASDVYKRQAHESDVVVAVGADVVANDVGAPGTFAVTVYVVDVEYVRLSLIHISEPTRPY